MQGPIGPKGEKGSWTFNDGKPLELNTSQQSDCLLIDKTGRTGSSIRILHGTIDPAISIDNLGQVDIKSENWSINHKGEIASISIEKIWEKLQDLERRIDEFKSNSPPV
jgi:hypothetical protein